MKKPGIPSQLLYIFAFIAGMTLLVPSIDAQVNQEELGQLGPVEFINYEGPYSRIETRAQIRSIGYSLGLAIKGGQTRTGSLGRYFVIHSVSAADGFKLDADIFGLGIDVGVDHIRNLRLIIQGYLEAAYDYTETDAALLAEYITIYNAVYRGDIEYFGSRYKNPVMDNLTKEKSGLSLRWDEWPGQTLMLIPLGMGLGGPLSSIDTSSISDSRVTEQLRQQPDMAVEQRKDMVDLKERESDEASQQAAISREAIREEEERIARERQEAQQQQQEAQQQQQEAQRQQQEAQRQQQEAERQRQEAEQERERIAQERQQPGADQAALDEDEARAEEQARQAEEQQAEAERQQQEAERQQQEAEQQRQEAQTRQEELNQAQEAADEQKATAEAEEAFAEQKGTEAQEDRQQIAEDQQTLINQEVPPAGAEGVLGVTILSPLSSLGRVVKLDPETGREIARSPLNTVNVRTVTRINDRIIAIAGENRGTGAIRLVEINSSTLEMQKQGDDDIAPQSLLWVNGENIFAVVNNGGNLYLAKFNLDLVLLARSSVTVHPFATVLFSDSYIVSQRADGSALLLNAGDLTEKR